MSSPSIVRRMHPETRIDGFSHRDKAVSFYSFVRAAALRTEATRILDFGAGSGAYFEREAAEDGSLWRAELMNLRNTGAHVVACDIDPAVRRHPCSDEQVVVTAGAPLPFADESFDVIVSFNTFEHIEDPAFTATELLRVLRPGGYVCASTPSRYGYVALAASLVPNRLHAAVLRRIQPRRRTVDVFPTFYRLNTPAELRRHFRGCEVWHYHHSSEPAYTFDRLWIYRAFLLLHRLLPGPLNMLLCAFIRKPAAGDGKGAAPGSR